MSGIFLAFLFAIGITVSAAGSAAADTCTQEGPLLVCGVIENTGGPGTVAFGVFNGWDENWDGRHPDWSAVHDTSIWDHYANRNYGPDHPTGRLLFPGQNSERNLGPAFTDTDGLYLGPNSCAKITYYNTYTVTRYGIQYYEFHNNNDQDFPLRVKAWNGPCR